MIICFSQSIQLLPILLENHYRILPDSYLFFLLLFMSEHNFLYYKAKLYKCYKSRFISPIKTFEKTTSMEE